MQLRDNGLRFSPITVVLHWVVALSLLAILCLQVVIGQASSEAGRTSLEHLQNLMGLILFLVSIYRFWARITSYHPLPVGTPNPIEVIISRSVAAALALAMVLLPVAPDALVAVTSMLNGPCGRLAKAFAGTSSVQ